LRVRETQDQVLEKIERENLAARVEDPCGARMFEPDPARLAARNERTETDEVRQEERT
jgi:hypothetical protein